jgi:poly(A) polymerase
MAGAMATIGPILRLFDAAWLRRTETQAVFAALTGRGHQARAVGGAVRNALLGLTVGDVDIATTASPDEIIAAAQLAGLKAVPTGIAHGTVTVVVNHIPFEVTTLREDVATFGRHAQVAFTKDWVADARRRDFTINALYCGADGEVFDPLGGYVDLMARRVRFIGDARKRIREDYLRILRFFRFSAEYADHDIDIDGLAACVTEREGLALLSAERVRGELLRLLAATRAPAMIEKMLEYGLIVDILGAAPRPALMARLAAIESQIGRTADPVLRLAALAVEVSEDADRLQRRLRLSGEEHAKLLFASTRTPAIDPSIPEVAAKAALYHHSADEYRCRVLLAWARSQASISARSWQRRLELPDRWQPPEFPISGADVIALGVPAGPRVGCLLGAIEAWWIARNFQASRSELLRRLEKLARKP